MSKRLIFINNPSDISAFNLKQILIGDSKIFSFNFMSHKSLEKQKIDHTSADDYLSYDDRLKLFDLSLNYADKWYENESITKDFTLEGINLLGIVDTIELQLFLIHNMILFLTIKRVIEKEQPEEIIATDNLLKTINPLITDKKIKLKSYSSNSAETLFYDKINFMFNIGPIPISFYISRSNYAKIKNSLEWVVTKMFNLSFDLNNQNKTVLLLEFNPSAYPDLLHNLSKYNKNVVIFNRRRPATWNLSSLRTLRKFNCKMISSSNFLHSKEKKRIQQLYNQFFEKSTQLWDNEKFFISLFSLEGYSFWPSICKVFINMYNNRILEYIYLIILSKKILENSNISCIFSFYEIGETEKAILKINDGEAPSILHQHGFDNLTFTLAKSDPMKIIPLISDKIAVYGHIQKKYLINQQHLDPARILVTGSPRHDPFFKQKKITNNKSQKTILITPVPITEFTALPKTDLYIKFENIIRKCCEILKKMNNVKIIVKMHPSQEEHNKDIRKLFKEIDPSIPVYQITPIIDLISSCDAVLNINPESYNSSTVIMESLILEKPTITVVLDEQYHEMEFIKDKAVIVGSENSDLESILHDILFDEDKRNNLIINGRKQLEKYLVNHGNASEYLADIINSC